ncbi:MAG: zinc ribbon domain-containing protein [Clostridia bacterium]|nr:zinc ribbon domain-containing protein [Clostridia bacterium]
MEENKNQEPKFYKVMRILSPILLAVGVLLIVLANTAFKIQTKSFGARPNFGLLVPGIFIAFLAVPTFFIGFMPKIAKGMAKTNIYLSKEIQQEHKEDLHELANTGADISSEAITKTTRAVKKGLKDTKFCKHCGSEIDVDSIFCKSCGKKQ